MTITVERPTANARTLITPQLLGRLVARIRADHPQHAHQADQIMEQALAFLATCAANPDARLGPSELVDIGWHTFILYTKEYAEFCFRAAGRFIHHQPDDAPGESAGGGPAATMTAMKRAGYRVDLTLWPHSAKCNQKCSQCHEGCVDST
ncbi:glycine-rich domain-containing protein [Nonomuraea cavernae]|uniref:Uncharacterized protein n=1 Tax=Nonomuraea cavernae TaxID=2045107 RepID=A0A917Z231_9ACTN|nr:hypothetical protein [Nonomuraea cavernae]MCA2187679.1 hypothetical protein [Nonomuraea cavernae]GGO70833.1 hypothetical protein GCM10012289_35150 [Nonomuraea cavernae]